MCGIAFCVVAQLDAAQPIGLARHVAQSVRLREPRSRKCAQRNLSDCAAEAGERYGSSPGPIVGSSGVRV
jgi:hypothetical protein